MHDTKIAPLDVKVAVPEGRDHVILVVVDGMLLPTAEGLAQIPTGQYQFPLTKDLAMRIGEALREASEMVEEEPRQRVEVATSMAQAKSMAAQEAAIRSLRDGV